jgi:hypothetical protein
VRRMDLEDRLGGAVRPLEAAPIVERRDEQVPIELCVAPVIEEGAERSRVGAPPWLLFGRARNATVLLG